ncbi:MAG: hypothetical protein AAGB32_01425 [Pseudomonadota bacterium]
MHVSTAELERQYGSHAKAIIYYTSSRTGSEPAVYSGVNQVDITEQLGPLPVGADSDLSAPSNAAHIVYYADTAEARHDLLSSRGIKDSGLLVPEKTISETPLPKSLNAPTPLEEGQTLFRLIISMAENNTTFDVSETSVMDVRPDYVAHCQYFGRLASEKGYDVGFWYETADAKFLSFEENADTKNPRKFIRRDTFSACQGHELLFLSNTARSRWMKAANTLLRAAEEFSIATGIPRDGPITRLLALTP